jgi:hypothetical protein
MNKTDKTISLLLNTKGGNPRCEDIACSFSYTTDFDYVTLGTKSIVAR